MCAALLEHFSSIRVRPTMQLRSCEQYRTDTRVNVTAGECVFVARCTLVHAGVRFHDVFPASSPPSVECRSLPALLPAETTGIPSKAPAAAA